MSGRHRRPSSRRGAKIAAAGAAFGGLALATASPAAAIEFTVPGVGTFSGHQQGVRLKNYDYGFSYTSPNGNISRSLESSGTPDGISSHNESTFFGTSRSITQSYASDYEGSTCILCQETSRTTKRGTWGTEYNVLSDGIELEVTTPNGNFSLPRE